MDKLSLLAATDVLYFLPSPRRNVSPCCLSFRNKNREVQGLNLKHLVSWGWN